MLCVSSSVNKGLIRRTGASLLHLQQLGMKVWKCSPPHLIVSLKINQDSPPDANLTHSGTNRVLFCHFHLLWLVPVETGAFCLGSPLLGVCWASLLVNHDLELNCTFYFLNFMFN